MKSEILIDVRDISDFFQVGIHFFDYWEQVANDHPVYIADGPYTFLITLQPLEEEEYGKGKIDRREKVIPGEILKYKGTLNRMAANINQIAKKKNSNEALNEEEKNELCDFEKLTKQHIKNVKNQFQ